MASSIARSAFDTIADRMKPAYMTLERLHSSLGVAPEDDDLKELNTAKRGLLVSNAKKYLLTLSPTELAILCRSCQEALSLEEEAIRKVHDIPLNDDDDSSWFLPSSVLTSKYIVYDRISKDAPQLVTSHFKKLCNDESKNLQLCSNSAGWVIKGTHRSYIFTLTSVSTTNNLRHLSAKHFDSVYNDVKSVSSKYPIELISFCLDQLSTLLYGSIYA